ncbi:Eco57I restriction-modification methylase domain-containing protein [Haliangium sp.]|uniref:Eco57I restriction-modification methylase domain-containing protein n=1 Tax=Haliangium sp. TaxID=2663208 RepID=UPI003D0C1688
MSRRSQTSPPDRRTPAPPTVASEAELVALARALGADTVPDLSADERRLEAAPELDDDIVDYYRRHIHAGRDPLGDAFCRLRSPRARRARGAVYTPPALVQAMLAWTGANTTPDRVVDPGAGSGRFIVAAGRRFPAARLVAVELDPLAALIARAHLAACGFAERAQVVRDDYCTTRALPRIAGTSLFIGNPPYVRHHDIPSASKQWFARAAAAHGIKASKLAGLHAYFFLATAQHARPGDCGVFVTSSEWLDVNYGALIRELFLRQLGGGSVHLLSPEARPFSDAMTTAVIATFRVGAGAAAVRVRAVSAAAQLGALRAGRAVARDRLEAARRWSPLIHGERVAQAGMVPLGELCRVSRGQVTGANKVWIAGPEHDELPTRVLFPAVTRAREVFAAGATLDDTSALRRVIDLPVELDDFSPAERRLIERFLARARAQGVPAGYIARHRRAWWSVGLHPPAPILATYMARRAPGFTRNLGRARHINIAHGLYPRVELSEHALGALVEHLNQSASVRDGRTYAGGLAKFEPGEMARLPVPEPALLERLGTARSARE